MKALVLLKTADGGYWSVPLAAALRDRGHEVLFAVPSIDGPLPDAVRAAGMAVVRAEAPLMGAGLARQPAALRRLRHQITRDIRPAVVVSHLYASALAGRAATAGTRIPHVYMVPGPLYLENPLIKLVERGLWHLDDHVICSSGALYEAYARLGVPSHRRSLVPYTLDPAWGASLGADEQAVARAELGLDPDGFIACCVAMFYAPKALVHRDRGIKGHDDLFEAWARYRDGGGQGRLLLVGGGLTAADKAYRADLFQRYERLPGTQWIERVPDVRPYYRAADVSISPSLSDNIGAPSEAGSLGIPTIATNVGALPEIVVDGWNGWLVPPRDPRRLAAAITEADAVGPEERRRRGVRARRRADELMDRPGNAAAFATIVERAAGGG